MTSLLPLASRRSRWLFDWSAAACLAAPDQSLNASTGQVATFTRAGIKWAFDGNGVARVVAHSRPAFQWSLDPVSGLMVPAVLLDDTATNVALWNRDLTNAAWTKTTMTAAKDQTGVSGVANSASSLLATAGNATALQAITLASSSRRQSAYVKRITGSGTVQMTTDNGGTWTTIATTTAWTRFSIPAQTLANPTVGFRLVTNGDKIAVDFVQNEVGPITTSPIATTTVAVTRVADALSFVFNAPPQAMTMYAQFVEVGATLVGDRGLIAIDAASVAAPRLLFEVNGPYLFNHWNGVTNVQSVAAATPAIGQTVELAGQLTSTGAAQLFQSLDGGTTVAATQSLGATLASAWSATTLFAGSLDASGLYLAPMALRSLRIAAGVQAMAAMRAG